MALLRPDVDFARVDGSADLEALPKVRAIDPPVLVDDRVVPLSQLDAAFARHREAYIASKQGMWQLRVLA